MSGSSRPKRKPSIGILSLGCPRNLVDSEQMLGRLHRKGHAIVDIQRSDIAIVNTCAFVNDAKTESIDAILDLIQLKKEGRIRKVVVCGCLAQRYGDTLRREMPEVDAFIGSGALEEGARRFALTPRHYAYLKISEGCLSECSFCVIPSIKGRYRSMPVEELVRQVRELDRLKVRELNIIGQDSTAYGVDLPGQPSLAQLLERLLKEAAHIPWFRLLYLHPSRITPQLLAVIRSDTRVCRYIDVPVQHCNERILKRMHRGGSRLALERMIERIRRELPGVSLRTSVIVGFPSETEKEFEELLSFLREVRFERLGAFIYSAEEGTPAAAFAGQVPDTVQQERFNRLMALQQDISREHNTGFMGREIEVLIEERSGRGEFTGRSRFDAPEVDGLVYVRSAKKFIPGNFAKVKICDTLEYDLVGDTV